ncbi:4-hydroxyphenylpyruvate dioxygenase-like protein [Babylonia areolata]|uniref:4-hydroxyphenylpyruvate dioxygenase-like protein n=1 Tax=Babylonia areolata TaxID=304850 RepID=UPI003FD42005
MEPKCVHHIEFGVRNGLKHVQNFLSRYKFRLAGTRITPGSKQWLVSSSAVRFLITELSSKDNKGIGNDPYVHPWAFPTENNSQPVRDSVFNIALRVKNIEGFVNRLSKQNVQFIKPLQTVSDPMGSVRVCMVKSCVGNVVHTLVEDSQYSGFFLPGFQTAENDKQTICDVDEMSLTGLSSPRPAIDLQHIDHVTFCVPRGSSVDMIKWYEKCFGMKRFFINREDDDAEGFVISGKDVGMRLKAFEYWKCAETGLATEEKAMGSVKFVIAETLPDQGPNQLEMFLKNHGGAGVQHVGLHTGDIVGAISQLQANGVKFNEAPYTYYTEVGRLKEMLMMGVDVDLIRQNGILVDLERDDDVHTTNVGGDTAPGASEATDVRYLMQKFTQPLFDADTFYLEVIQRVGATGFGSGNITALWRSLQAYFQEKEMHHSKDTRDQS